MGRPGGNRDAEGSAWSSIAESLPVNSVRTVLQTIELMILGIDHRYEGQAPCGSERVREMWYNIVCLRGYTWDVPNLMRADVDTGERVFRNDYHQDMILWSLPAAIEGRDVSAPTKPGALVDRIIKTARATTRGWRLPMLLAALTTCVIQVPSSLSGQTACPTLTDFKVKTIPLHAWKE